MKLDSIKQFKKIFGGAHPVMLRAQPLSASISIDDVSDAFYEDFATWEEGRYWWWIQLMLLSPDELIVNDGWDDLYRMAFTVTDNGPGNEPTVEFGDLVPIRLEPVDTTILEEDEPLAASAKLELVSAAVAGIVSARGPERVAASYKSREDSRPNAKKEDEQVREYLKRMRAKLGLADDVPDEKVLELAATRLEAVPDPAPEGDPAPGEGDPVPPPIVDPVPDPAPAPTPTTPVPGEEQPQARVVSADALAALQAEARMGREAREEQLRGSDERYVDAAIATGKIPSRSRESSLKRMGRSAEARAEERAFIDELSENVIPVELRGSGEGTTELTNGGGGGSSLSPALSAWAERHLPEAVARRQAVEARAASGERSRILTDA